MAEVEVEAEAVAETEVGVGAGAATVAGHVVADTFARILIAISFHFLLLFFAPGRVFSLPPLKSQIRVGH